MKTAHNTARSTIFFLIYIRKPYGHGGRSKVKKTVPAQGTLAFSGGKIRGK